jgi:hypothetical protein
VSPVKYEQGFYITEDAILRSYRRENLKSYNDMIASDHASLRERILEELRPLGY